LVEHFSWHYDLRYLEDGIARAAHDPGPYLYELLAHAGHMLHNETKRPSSMVDLANAGQDQDLELSAILKFASYTLREHSFNPQIT
jgi:hypothetical protein